MGSQIKGAEVRFPKIWLLDGQTKEESHEE